MRMLIAIRENFICGYCGKYIGHSGCVADRISQSKNNRKKHGSDIIDHPYNKVYTCITNKCNDKYNIGNNPNKANKLIELIIKNGNDNLSAKEITKIINE